MERADAAQRLLAVMYDSIGVVGAVCGGYVRDTVLDRPIRDVDLYVAEQDFGMAYRHLFGKVNIPVESFDSDSEEYKHQSITMRAERDLSAELADGLGLPVRTVDLIALNGNVEVNAREITDRFNLGISKAGIDVGGLYVSPDLRADADDQMITLLRTSWGYESSMKKFVKLQAKYPWPLRIKQQEYDFGSL